MMRTSLDYFENVPKIYLFIVHYFVSSKAGQTCQLPMGLECHLQLCMGNKLPCFATGICF